MGLQERLDALPQKANEERWAAYRNSGQPKGISVVNEYELTQSAHEAVSELAQLPEDYFRAALDYLIARFPNRVDEPGSYTPQGYVCRIMCSVAVAALRGREVFSEDDREKLRDALEGVKSYELSIPTFDGYDERDRTEKSVSIDNLLMTLGGLKGVD